jgi:hypothetical protein
LLHFFRQIGKGARYRVKGERKKSKPGAVG